jgi:hypothetical protein
VFNHLIELAILVTDVIDLVDGFQFFVAIGEMLAGAIVHHGGVHLAGHGEQQPMVARAEL